MNPFPLAGGERWYVAHTLPMRESAAEMHLSAQKFKTFVPRRTKTVRHARRLRTVQTPVFSRYLFVALDLKRDRWRSVNGTTGVAYLLTADDIPVPVPEGIVETLLASTNERGTLEFDKAPQPGQEVRLIAGPFADALGTIERVSDAGRVDLLLQIMGGHVRVNVSHQWLDVSPH